MSFLPAVPRSHIIADSLIMVACSTITAACLSGLILGSLMCTVVLLCRKYKRDPDNIAPAIASCLGDLFTLVLLGTVSTLLVPFIRTPIPFFVGTMVVFLALGCFVYALRNEHVRPLLKEGWSPLFIAMAISSGTGIVLDMFVSRYESFALLAVVISGSLFRAYFTPMILPLPRITRCSGLDFHLSLIDCTACDCAITPTDLLDDNKTWPTPYNANTLSDHTSC